MTLPPRIYVLPDGTLPGVGFWIDRNNGSMAMERAVEYVPASEAKAADAREAKLRSAFRVHMLRHGPPGTSHEDIDAILNEATK